MLIQIYDHYIIIENIEFFSTGVHVYRSGFLEHDIEINNFYKKYNTFINKLPKSRLSLETQIA